jgi:hypothetical protein
MMTPTEIEALVRRLKNGVCQDQYDEIELYETEELMSKAATALTALQAERDAAVARAEAAEATIARLIAELAEAWETLRMFKAWDFPGDLQDMAVQLEAEKARAPTLAEALAVPEVASLVEIMTRIRNYCAHSPISQGEINCAAWANAALDRIKGAV